MSAVDVLAGELRVTNTDYSTGITTAIAEAAATLPAGTYWLVSDEARDAVAELIEAAWRVCERSPATAENFGLDAALARCKGEV